MSRAIRQLASRAYSGLDMAPIYVEAFDHD